MRRFSGVRRGRTAGCRNESSSAGTGRHRTRLLHSAVFAAALVALALLAPAAWADVTLVKQINPSRSADPLDLTDVNGTLFFAANDGSHGFELTAPDGAVRTDRLDDAVRVGGSRAQLFSLLRADGTTETERVTLAELA